jgi:hypothetical protein
MTTANADARSADAWSETKQRIHERWPGLDEADVDATQGDRTALVALLQARMGYARPNAEEDLDEILAGANVIPKDVADEETHTGTSGPVGAVSDATDFAGDARPKDADGVPATAPHRGDLNAGDASNASAGGPRMMDPPVGAADNDARNASDRLYEAGMPSGSGPRPTEPGPEAQYSGGGGGSGGNDWSDRWRHMGNNGDRMPMLAPPKVIAIAGAAGTLIVIGILVSKRRQHKKTRSEQVAEQARHLLEEISERMPSVEELRDKVRSFDELRDRKMAHR